MNHHYCTSINPSISSQIHVKVTLCAVTSRHNQNRNNLSPVKQWYNTFPTDEQTQTQTGIEALLYEGCMTIARRTSGTVVRQEMANADNTSGGTGHCNDEDGNETITVTISIVTVVVGVVVERQRGQRK